MRNRAYRRMKERHSKQRASRRMSTWFGPGTWLYRSGQVTTPDDVARWIGKAAHTAVPCSDPFCCGNPRRRGELTMQERRAPTIEEVDK